ncbi:YtxH domain-containing protein [Candidatus Roizmanbacteria bacterium]|nr:YtxH domain-containing protein [Candidatus Roizmanbacteria bacterium]
MADDQKSSKFGVGVLIGTLLGGLAALFLSPTSGEENREIVAKKVKQLEKLLEEAELDKKLKSIFGETTEEVKEIYLQAKKEVIKKLAALKEAVESIDKAKYEKVVHETVNLLKKEAKREAGVMEKLKEELLKEWKKLEPKKKK